MSERDKVEKKIFKETQKARDCLMKDENDAREY